MVVFDLPARSALALEVIWLIRLTETKSEFLRFKAQGSVEKIEKLLIST
jgi:hypothetical protein